MIKATGPNRIFEIDSNNHLLVYKKNGKLIVDKSLNDVTVLCFNSKNFLGNGQIYLKVEGIDNPISDGFNSKERDNFTALFNYLCQYCEFKNMTVKEIISSDFSEVKQSFRELKEEFTPTEEEKLAKQKEREYKSDFSEVKQSFKELKEEFTPTEEEKLAKQKEREYKKAKEMTQTRCECRSCGNIYYYSDKEAIAESGKALFSLGLMLGGNTTSAVKISNSSVDLSRCPKCGSRIIVKTEEKYLVNKAGEIVER